MRAAPLVASSERPGSSLVLRLRSSTTTTRPSARRGGALVLSLVAVAAVAVVSMAYLRLAATTARAQAARVHVGSAFYLAEAGLVEAYAGLSLGRTGNVGSIAAPARYGDGLFWVEATPVGADRVELVSTGMSQSGRATLSVVVEREWGSVVSLGMFSSGPIEVPSRALVDGYDSREGTYAEQAALGEWATSAGRLGSNGDVVVRGTRTPAVVNGDVAVGPGGSAVVERGARVTGETTARAEAVRLPFVTSGGLARSRALRHDGLLPLVIGPGSYGVEAVRVGAGAELVVRGPAMLELGELDVAPTGRIVLDGAEGAIELVVDGPLRLAAGAIVETTSVDPSRVQIQVAGDGDATLAASGAFHGLVYAPEATVTVGRTFEVFGGVVAGGLALEPGARLHFDRSLVEMAETLALPSLLAWRIVDLGQETGGAAAADPFRLLGVDRAALLPPSAAHEDQRIAVRYVDAGGATRSFSGWESAFDWSDVRRVLSLQRDGVLVAGAVAPAPPPADPFDFLEDPELSSSELKDRLLARSPLDDPTLLRVIDEADRMESSDLKAVLERNVQASAGVLVAAVGCPVLTSSDLKSVLVACSPLRAAVLTALGSRDPPMDASHHQAVLDAQ